MKLSNIPTNGYKKYAELDLINILASYEECKQAVKDGFLALSDWYWFDNTAWNKNEPIGIMSQEDAFYEEKKGCSFIEFDTTVPAYTKEQIKNFYCK